MQNTTNFNLQKPDYNNVADIQVLNDNFDKIDNGLSKFYVATLESTNVYKITTGINKTSLANGYSIKVAIPSDSNGAVSLKVDNVTVQVKKPNGNPVTNFKSNGVYNLTYYNSVFILASGSDESDSTSVGTDGSKVLAPETFIGSDGEIHTGTIPIRTAVNTTLKAGQSVSLESGYYKDKSTIKAETLATTMTNAGVTLTSASQLVKDVKAVDKTGKLITGTATIESLGGLRIKTGSGTYTPTYNVATNSYGNKYLESETLTIPLNLDFEPKILIALLPVYRYTSTMDCPFIWDMYSKKYIEGIVNFPYNSSTSWNNAPSSKDITSIGKKEVSIKARDLASNGTWRFESTGTVSNAGNTLIIKPVPVTWWALG